MRRSFTDTRHQRRLVAGTISTIVVMTSLAGLRPLGATALAQMPRTQSSMMQQRSLKLMTWNVNGIRSVLKYEAKREQLEQLLATEKPDVTFLQEHRQHAQMIACMCPLKPLPLCIPSSKTAKARTSPTTLLTHTHTPCSTLLVWGVFNEYCDLKLLGFGPDNKAPREACPEGWEEATEGL
eukprot:6051036-Amphidinium_carterae.1